MTVIAIGSDHAAFQFKALLRDYVTSKGLKVLDVGVEREERCDYPDFAVNVAESILEGRADKGILCCGSGIGMSMQANRFKGIRAALVWNDESARLSKQHNNANVLCLGARLHTHDELFSMVQSWLDASFEDRHQHRIDKLDR